MKIVVALDKFKGSLTAARACAIVGNALHNAHPSAEIILKPMADGGDGTAAVIHAALGGEWIEHPVTGPLPAIRNTARYLWLADQHLAVVEMAAASGLALLRPDQRDPLRTTTLGTGELIQAAQQRGAQKILLGVGGSATVDGGVGAAMALGWKFLDAHGQPVGLGGGELARIATIIPGTVKTQIEVLCDVDSPLCGEHGSARTFGPQKGATPAVVEQLEAGLRHLAQLVAGGASVPASGEQPPPRGDARPTAGVHEIPGAGAAGGLAFGAAAFLGAQLVSGIEAVMAVTRFEESLRGADWVITGEGCFDEQSLRGKVVAGVLRLARQQGVRVAVLAGGVRIAKPVGIEIALATKPDDLPLDQALARAEELLAERARELAEQL